MLIPKLLIEVSLRLRRHSSLIHLMIAILVNIAHLQLHSSLAVINQSLTGMLLMILLEMMILCKQSLLLLLNVGAYPPRITHHRLVLSVICRHFLR